MPLVGVLAGEAPRADEAVTAVMVVEAMAGTGAGTALAEAAAVAVAAAALAAEALAVAFAGVAVAVAVAPVEAAALQNCPLFRGCATRLRLRLALMTGWMTG